MPTDGGMTRSFSVAFCGSQLANAGRSRNDVNINGVDGMNMETDEACFKIVIYTMCPVKDEISLDQKKERSLRICLQIRWSVRAPTKTPRFSP